MNKNIDLFSYIFMGIAIMTAYVYKLMPTLISGVVIFIIINGIYNYISPKFHSKYSKKITLSLVVILISALFIAMSFGLYYAIKISNENIKELGEQVFTVLQEFKVYVPASFTHYIPTDITVFNEKVLELTKANSSSLLLVTSNSIKAFLLVILGIILGAVTASSFLNYSQEKTSNSLLVNSLLMRIKLFGESTKRVVFAQIKISLINTVLSSIYFLIILPLFATKLPHTNVLILLTFILGLIPIIGNIISNTIVMIIGLSVSFKLALFSLVYMIFIHKLEYYINARIVGKEIKTNIWEILIVMVLMETLFGIVGLATSTIIYGYIKEELKLSNLI